MSLLSQKQFGTKSGEEAASIFSLEPVTRVTNILPSKEDANDPRYLRLLQWLLCVIAMWSFTWPVYRAFLSPEIENNEGWNAYFADAAMGRMPLYPSKDQLITNNYPPLSFYIVGMAGRVIGDPVLAGRLLSLIAVLAIAAAVALSVRRLGGTTIAATISAAFYLGTMSRFFILCVGMDEPQLLAEAIMAFAFVWFLGARSRDRGYIGPILVMAAAGFVKHNIIAMPLAALLWLACNRRREFVNCVCVAAIASAAGIGVCYALFGRDFFFNMLSPRLFSLNRTRYAFEDLEWVAVGLVACVYNDWARGRRDGNVRLGSSLIAIGLLSFYLQRCGAGVDINAQFDLVIGVAIGLGLAFTQIPQWPITRWIRPKYAQAILLFALCLRLLASRQMQPVRLAFDPRFRSEIAIRERAMTENVERVRRIPGDVTCGKYLLVSYRAGKPFVVDDFNAQQRILAGALPKDAITSRIAAGKLTVVEIDHRSRWGEEQKHFDFTTPPGAPFHVVSNNPMTRPE